MKKYKYVRLENIEKYNDWEVIEIVPRYNDGFANMALIMKEDIPVQDYIKLNEATNEQLLEELYKRLK